MLSSLRRSALLATLAVIGAGAGPILTLQPTMVSAAPLPVRAGKRSLFGGVRASVSLYGRRGAGISVAQGKRNASKARNVARNRRAHR